MPQVATKAKSRKAASAVPKIPVAAIPSCGDVSCEFLIDPVPRPVPPSFKLTLKPRAQRVRLIDNLKPNSLEILKMTQSILRDRGVEVEEEIIGKFSGTPVEGDLLLKLKKDPALLLFGIND